MNMAHKQASNAKQKIGKESDTSYEVKLRNGPVSFYSHLRKNL